jgi:hypothetical protein
MPNFVISMNRGQVDVQVNEYLDPHDVERMLSFEPEQVEDLLRTHSGNQEYWEALTVRLRSRFESFRDNWSRKWWAHCSHYARIISAVYGDAKPTAQPTNDLVIQIYSMDTSQATRDRYAYQAWTYEVKKSTSVGTLDEYTAQMFKYLLSDPAWYFETIVESQKQLQEQYDMVRIVSERLNSKAFDMGLYTKMQMAKRGNVGQ